MQIKRFFPLLFICSFFLLVSCSNEPETPKENNQSHENESPKQENKSIELLEADENLIYGIPVQKEISSSTKEKEIQETIMVALQSFEIIVKDVEIKDDVASINFDKKSLDVVTSSAQYGVVMDYINYAMVKNFPEIKGYYLLADQKPTAIGESVVLDEMFANTLSDHMYLQIKDNS